MMWLLFKVSILTIATPTFDLHCRKMWANVCKNQQTIKYQLITQWFNVSSSFTKSPGKSFSIIRWFFFGACTRRQALNDGLNDGDGAAWSFWTLVTVDLSGENGEKTSRKCLKWFVSTLLARKSAKWETEFPQRVLPNRSHPWAETLLLIDRHSARHRWGGLVCNGQVWGSPYTKSAFSSTPDFQSFQKNKDCSTRKFQVMKSTRCI